MVTRRSRTYLLALASICAAVVAGCGSSSSTNTGAKSTTPTSSSSGTSGAGSGDKAVEALVPAAVKAKGVLTVAEDASYAPDEYIAPDGRTVIGMDADLAKALAAEMGLKANVLNVTFAQIIPGMLAGKYDLGASSFTDNKVREKQVSFVDYASVGESFYTKAQGGTQIASIADICGKTVAVESTTTEQTDATAQDKKCKAAGKPGVTVLVFPNQNLANLAVSSGRAQLGFVDTPVAGYQVTKTHGLFKVVGAAYAPAPYGLAVPKGTGMDTAVKAALLALIKNGTYTQIFTKWNVASIAIPASKVVLNGATS